MDTYYSLCYRCAAAMENCDFSAFDLYDYSDEFMESVYGMVDQIGLVIISEHYYGGYYTCDVCNEINAGDGYITEPIES